MKRIGATAVLFALTLAGCGASKGNRTACELVVNSENRYRELIVGFEKAKDEDEKTFYQELGPAARDNIATQIDLAITKADDAKLLGNLSDLRNHWAIHHTENDSILPYLQSLTTVVDTCKSLGAQVTIKDLD